MNLSEHPQAIDLMKRIAVSEADPKFVPVQLFMPGMGHMMGTVRLGKTPGLFILTSNVQIEGTDIGSKGIMDFSFTADKPTMILHPDLDKTPSRIVS